MDSKIISWVTIFAISAVGFLSEALAGDTNILYGLNGDITNDRFGYSVSGAGDVNNDGYDDLIIGIRDNYPNHVGQARVISGTNGKALYTFYGDSYDLFGDDVSGAGDVNGDGYSDVIVGAIFDDNNGADSGSVRVFSGVDGSTLYTFDGDNAGDYFGGSVSSAGDVNNDGYDDVIVGAEYDDNGGTSSGIARVFSGINGSVLYTFDGAGSGWRLGASVAGAGDVNNDGYADLVVGAPHYSSTVGLVKVYSGVDGSTLYTFTGDTGVDEYYLGRHVNGAGDVNNDGYADIIMSGLESNVVRVASGQDGSYLYTIGAGVCGSAVSGADDVNGDGYGDFMIGDCGDQVVTVYSGINASVLYAFNGESAGDEFGNSLGIGDVNNDGYTDFIVGASYDDNNGTNSGSVRVFNGKGAWTDTDGDSVYDDDDSDDDNDSLSDIQEAILTTGPLNRLDPPRVSLTNGYLMGLDDIDFLNSIYARYGLWDGSGFIGSGTIDKNIENFVAPNGSYGCSLIIGVVDCGNGTLSNVVEAHSGQYYSCALQTDGDIFCWNGGNISGTATDITSNLTSLSAQIVDMAVHGASDTRGCGVDGGNDYACWGMDGTYAVTNPFTYYSSPSPSLSSLSAIAVGANHVCVIDSGYVHCRATSGTYSAQLGDSDSDGYVDISGTEITDARKIVAGDDFTCALRGAYETGSGAVYCWGSGKPTITTPTKPVDIIALGDSLCLIDAGVANQEDMVNSLFCYGTSVPTNFNTDADGDTYSDSCEQTNSTDPLDDTDYPGSC